ncbi:MAG: Gfo/Idh/MocA family oxidoreductase [Armatimonadetes bacterium]|nr:Gfo/Idh/MocA family oxidoreductase [Armatimonadota bacterium]
MDKVKYGVIGLGWFGGKHVEVLNEIPNVELYALCTRTESRLEELAKEYGVEKTYTDYNEMLADPELEAVSITTMWDQHAAPTIAALEAGKHVFCEKPMASTREDCEAIVKAAHAASGKFMVGHIVRFNPRYAMAKREIAEGKVGKIVSMFARRNIPAWVTEEILMKIGPIVGDGVHDMDIMLWCSGLTPKTVYAKTVNERGKKYPDLGWSMFTMDNGAIAVLENVWFLPDKTAMQIDERMEIIGTEGSVHVQEVAPSFAVCDQEKWTYPDTTYWPTIHGRCGGALRDELRYFADCIQMDVEPDIITPEESMATVLACLAAEESAATGKEVEIEWF